MEFARRCFAGQVHIAHEQIGLMIYTFEDFELDTQFFELRRAGHPRPVEPQVFNVLAYLIQHRDRVVSKKELLDALWAGRVVAESTLNSRIKAARKALDDSGEAQRIIVTIQRRGYRFVANVQEQPMETIAAHRQNALTDSTTERDNAVVLLQALDPEADRVSLAVIPFAHNPANPQIAWLADTLTADISIQLARIPGFVVISRNSTSSYKDREVGLRQIGQELNARYLVEGSMWEAGDRLRVSVQLMEAASGQILWADRCEIGAGDLHDMQNDAVRGIVSHIEPEILRAELPTLRQRRSVDLGAWSLYRQAHALLGLKGWNTETCPEVIVLLRQAIQQSPELAFAHAYLALVLAIGHLMGLVAGNASQAEARCAAEQALVLDSQDSDVLGYAGCAFADLGDTVRGIGLLERAVELDPSNAQARAALGAALLQNGKPEGIEHMRYGMHISPRDNRLAVWGALLARGLLNFKRIDEAMKTARAACRHDDKLVLPRIVLALAYANMGAMDDAAAAISDARRIQPQLTLDTFSWMARSEEIEVLKRV